jgi:hypothetical protein
VLFPNIHLVERKCPCTHRRRLKITDHDTLTLLLVRESISFVIAVTSTSITSEQDVGLSNWRSIIITLILPVSSRSLQKVRELPFRWSPLHSVFNYFTIMFAVGESFGEDNWKVGHCPSPPLADREHDTCLRFSSIFLTHG